MYLPLELGLVVPSKLGTRGSGKLFSVADRVIFDIWFGLNFVVFSGGADVRCWTMLRLLLRGLVVCNRRACGSAATRQWWWHNMAGGIPECEFVKFGKSWSLAIDLLNRSLDKSDKRVIGWTTQRFFHRIEIILRCIWGGSLFFFRSFFVLSVNRDQLKDSKLKKGAYWSFRPTGFSNQSSKTAPAKASRSGEDHEAETKTDDYSNSKDNNTKEELWEGDDSFVRHLGWE